MATSESQLSAASTVQAAGMVTVPMSSSQHTGITCSFMRSQVSVNCGAVLSVTTIVCVCTSVVTLSHRSVAVTVHTRSKV